MSKRKLTKQQRRRIAQNQSAQLTGAAIDDNADNRQHGLVIRHHGKQVKVEDSNGDQHVCHFRANLQQLVVGDRVAFQPEDSEFSVITAIDPRRNVLKRPDPYGKLKPVAANLDRLFIVFAAEPIPSSQLIDRYLVAAELAGINASLIINKTDLNTSLDALATIYQPLGYPLLHTSAQQQDISSLQLAIKQQTVAFVGQSGVGKSSLINALFPEAELATKQISDNSGLGQHTTVTSELLHLPDGGHVIDSPGIREFGLWHISEEELLSGYTELAPLAGHCKFRNCRHRNEPGCALKAAAENGDIHPQRLTNFFAIADTLDSDKRAKY